MSRTALYLDSIGSTRYPSSWVYTSEVLTTQLAMTRIGRDPDAFAYWGKLQQAIKANKVHELVSTFKADRWPDPIREYLAGTMVGACIEGKRYEEAQIILAKIPQLDKAPQIQYYRGLVNLMLGYNDKAQKLFEEIILATPDDVFAQKARIYLLKLKEFHSM